MTVTEIETAMLALPEDQRKELASRLLDSLAWENAFGNESEWLLAELDRRDHDSDPKAWLDGEAVLASARDRHSA